ncbi:MAG: hypothetical protein Rubg2KO_13830 [Rubricoccaceae bacterium]
MSFKNPFVCSGRLPRIRDPRIVSDLCVRAHVSNTFPHVSPLCYVVQRLFVFAVLVLGLLGADRTAAQAPPEVWTRLHSGDGLAHNSVYAIHQDRRGFMWFGTIDGLDRYDGYSFVSHRHDPADASSLPHNLIRSLHEDTDGTLWVGTQNGLARRGPRATGFDRFSVPADPNTGDRSVFEIGRDRRGGLWAATSGGLLRFDDTQDRFIRQLDGVALGLAMNADTLWVLRGSAPEVSSTLLQVDVRRQRVLRQWQVEAAEGTSLSLALDANGQIWLTGEGPAVFDGGRVDGGRVAYTTRVVEALPSGEVWVGGVGAGVRRCQDGGCTDALVDIDRPDWIHNHVRSVTEDRTGAVWVGTYGGVYRWDPKRKPFRTLRHRPRDPASLSTPAVSALAEDLEGQIWIGSFDGGLDRFNPATGRVTRFGVGSPVGSVMNGVWALHVDSRGRVWAGGGKGLGQIDPQTGRVRVVRGVAELLGGSVVTSLAEDANGAIWVGSFGGLVHSDPATGEVTAYPMTGDANGPSRAVVNAVRADGAHLWLGLPWGGLDRLDLASGRFDPVPLFDDGAGRFAGEATYDLYPDGHGGGWIATASGLYHTRPDVGVLQHLTTADGLPGTVVYSIQPDVQGRLWLGTSRGLARVEPATGEVTAYDLSDGIGMMEFNRSARLRTRDGRIWLGGSDGVLEFDPEAIRAEGRVPTVALVGIEVASRDSTRLVEPRELDRLVLSPLERTLTVTFSALTYSDPTAMRYTYRLEGLDADWVDAGTQRQARYTALPPGDYTLRVRASTPDGVESEQEAVLSVRVAPRMWETVWFRGLVLVGLVGLGVVAYRVRVGRLLDVERLRLRIAGDLHDDLASDLSGIALATDLLGRRPGLAEADRKRLADVRDAATSMADALRDIVWAVDPAHDSVEAFGRQVRLIAQRLLEGHEHTLDIDLGVSGGPLPMSVRRELVRILKESLHNVLRHADADHVAVTLRRDGSQLTMGIADDGVGFDPQAESNGHGLGSLQGRAERVGGTLDIESAPGTGTRVALAVDLARTREARRWRQLVPWIQRSADS